MAKKEFYGIYQLVKTGAKFLIPLSERNIGKSYQAKMVCIWEAFHEADWLTWKDTGNIVHKDRWQIAYLRRMDRDIKNNVVTDYFKEYDMIRDITGGKYDRITSYQGRLYFGYTDAKSKKLVRDKEIGQSFCISGAQHYKSLMYPKIGNILFEEVIPDDGIYVRGEVKNLLSIVSTIERRDKVRVFMIGNKMNRVCPYFSEWSLTNILRQKLGTIQIYHQPTGEEDEDGNEIFIDIAVEQCAPTSNKNLMFFGNKEKGKVRGEWYTELYPHLDKDYEDYEQYYDLLVIHNEFKFRLVLMRDVDNLFLYCYPYTGAEDKITRIITDEFRPSRFVTTSLEEVTKYDKIVRNLVKNKKIRFCDNLTGTDFYNVVADRGGL